VARAHRRTRPTVLSDRQAGGGSLPAQTGAKRRTAVLRRLYPLLAFLGGFTWDALTIGQRIRVVDFWRLGIFLLGAALLALWLARREALGRAPPAPAATLRGRLASLAWQAPYLLLQFFFGGIFSALFILYFKSSGHLGTWLTASFLAALLVGNEFAGNRYGQRFTLTWTLFALNAILLCNFALPHALGSLQPLWFYASTVAGATLTHILRWLAPGRPGRIGPSWALAVVLMLAFRLDMIAPVPLVKRQLAAGQDFVQASGRYSLQVERAAWWQWWREQAEIVHVPEGGRLYGLSAVFAPLGVTADLEHRWEFREQNGWRLVYRRPFTTTGGRDRGFRGYSWVLNPPPGDWRFVVATQDGRTIDILRLQVERGTPAASEVLVREID
jgi:hypothetical protein